MLMVLSSAAASTQTTILPDRADHAVDGRLQGDPARLRPDAPATYLTPTVSTVVMGGISIVLYIR